MTGNNNLELLKPLKYRVSIPEADEKLRKLCMDTAGDKYGMPLPDAVKARLEQELNAIEACGYASHYLIGAMLAEQSMAAGYPVATRGKIGSSFVANLCRITEVNSLPAHYWCPKCHHFELHGVGDYKVMGYDLPDKVCPECGATLIAEGADIEPEILMGIKLNREPDIALNVAAEIRTELAAYLKDTFGVDCVFRAGVKALLEDGTIRRDVHPGGVFIFPAGADISEVTEIRDDIPDDDFKLPVTECDYHELDGALKKYDLLRFEELSMLAILEERTGFPAKQVRTNDRNVLKVFHEEGMSFLPKRTMGQKEAVSLQDRVIIELKPERFSDFVRITAMLHGVEVWKDNAEQLIRSGKALSDCISTRDDVMQEMLLHGIPRTQAFGIMDHVRKGKGITKDMEWDMLVAGIPEWYIDSCSRIYYLYPRAHAVEYMLLYWKLAYYRLHFPEEYKNALKTVEKKAGTAP